MKKYLVLSYFIFFSLLVKGQSISSIDFVGLKKTNKELLYRFLDSEVGGQYNSVTIKEDVQELLNLGYFVSVKDSAIKEGEGIAVVFKCEEVFSLLPILLGGSVGSDYFVKAGIRNLNLWGRGGIMKVAYQYQDGHSYFFNATVPYIRKSNFGIGLDIKRFSSQEPIYVEDIDMVYDYFNNTIRLSSFYEFKMFHRLHLKGIYQQEIFSMEGPFLDHVENDDFPKELRNNGVGWRVLHEYADIDYFSSLSEGFKLRNYLHTMYLEGNDTPFYQFVSESSFYKTTSDRGDLALRFKFGLTSNNLGFFSPFTLDSYLNIRGVGNKVDRGTGQVVLNAEYRYVVKQTSFGCYQLVTFIDSGSWRKPFGSLDDFTNPDNLKFFQGVGGRLYFKKLANLVLRVDFGYDLGSPSTNGLVFGFGQYF